MRRMPTILIFLRLKLKKKGTTSTRTDRVLYTREKWHYNSIAWRYRTGIH